VFVAAELAVGGRLGVVDFLLYRRQSAEESKDGAEVLVAEIAEDAPGHDGGELASSGLAVADGFNEHGFVKIGNTGWVGSDIERRGVNHGAFGAIGTVEGFAAAKSQARDRVIVKAPRRVAFIAARGHHKKFSILNAFGFFWSFHVFLHRKRMQIFKHFLQEDRFRALDVDGRLGADIDDDGGQVFPQKDRENGSRALAGKACVRRDRCLGAVRGRSRDPTTYLCRSPDPR
jgi:hypothetical protein